MPEPCYQPRAFPAVESGEGNDRTVLATVLSQEALGHLQSESSDEPVQQRELRRVYENTEAEGNPEESALTQRYTQQLADQETRLQALAKERADFQAKRDAAQDELDKMIQELSLDTTL